MIQKLLHDISISITINEETSQNYLKYLDITKEPGWKVHQQFLVAIANGISQYMFSPGYTKLNKEEKDVQQRSFVIVKEVIDFLMNPLKGAEKHAAIKRYNKNMEATTKRKRPKGE